MSGSALGDWLMRDAETYVNPKTGGVSRRAACGWCGTRIFWFDGSLERALHAWGRCVNPVAADRRADEHNQKRRRQPAPTVPARPTTVLTITWDDGLGGEDIRRISRAFAERFSEKFEHSEVRVQTFGTVQAGAEDPAPPKKGGGSSNSP